MLASVDDRVDFQPELERVIANYKLVAHEVWQLVSDWVDIDLSFASLYLSFVALSLLPTILIVFNLRKKKIFPYVRDLGDRLSQVQSLQDKAERSVVSETATYFYSVTGENIRDVLRSIEKKVLRISDQEIQINDPKSAQNLDIQQSLKAIYEAAQKARASKDAGEKPIPVLNETEQLALDLNAEEDTKKAKLRTEYDTVRQSLRNSLYVKVAFAVISSAIIFYAFELMLTVFLVLSFLGVILTCFFILKNSYDMMTGPNNGIFDVFGMVILFLVLLGSYTIGVAIVANTLSSDVYDHVTSFLIIATFSLFLFFTVMAYRIFAYLHIVLCALGIYLLDLSGSVIKPAIDSFLTGIGV